MHCGIAQCKQTAVKLAYPIIAHLLGATRLHVSQWIWL